MLWSMTFNRESLPNLVIKRSSVSSGNKREVSTAAGFGASVESAGTDFTTGGVAADVKNATLSAKISTIIFFTGNCFIQMY